MSFTPTQEAQLLQLLAKQAELLSLADNQVEIISELGAGSEAMPDLTVATTIGDTDLLLVRQGTTDKSVAASVLKDALAIQDKAVTYAKIQDVTAGKVLGRDTSGNGVVQELPIAVDASGNVGIGTGSPATKLHAINTTAVVTEIRAGNSASYASMLVDGTGAAQLFAPGGTQIFNVNGAARARIASDGQQSSVIPGGTTLYPEYKCRAWVNFNGTGTVAIRGSGNVSSITDNGTGDYSVNFTTAMPDANYAVNATNMRGFDGASDPIIASVYNFTTYSNAYGTNFVRIRTTYAASSAADPLAVNVAIFR